VKECGITVLRVPHTHVPHLLLRVQTDLPQCTAPSGAVTRKSTEGPSEGGKLETVINYGNWKECHDRTADSRFTLLICPRFLEGNSFISSFGLNCMLGNFWSTLWYVLFVKKMVDQIGSVGNGSCLLEKSQDPTSDRSLTLTLVCPSKQIPGENLKLATAASCRTVQSTYHLITQ
jgi:hypothetical protein